MLLLTAGGGLLICLISIYLGRNALLRSIVNKRVTRIEQVHGLHIHYESLDMNGLNEVSIQGLTIIPTDEILYSHWHLPTSNSTSGN